MADPIPQDVVDSAFDLRIRGVFAAELEAAERDFRPPAQRDRNARSGSLVMATIVAAIFLPVAVAAIIATGTKPSIASTPSGSSVVSPSPTVGPSPTAAGSTSANPLWPGSVVATFESVADTLVYDPGRNVVWIPVIQTVGQDFLYRFDPAVGTTMKWDIPEATYRGIFAQVLVDGIGAVWINDDGYRLVRFDPGTGDMTSYVFPLEVPGVDPANDGTWVSAIAADGDGVLVARNQVSFLVRLGPTLAITKTVELPDGFAGATGLAVAGDRLFVSGGQARTVARLSRDGQLEERFVVEADRLAPSGDGVIATTGFGERGAAQVVAFDGTLVGNVAPPFTLPLINATVTNPRGVEVPVRIRSAPSGLVGNGQGTYWYIVNGDPVLREYIAPS